MDTERPPIAFYAFDLLWLNGKDLRDLAIEERKAKLAELFTESPSTLRYSISFTKNIEELLDRVRGLGLEVLIGGLNNKAHLRFLVSILQMELFAAVRMRLYP
jgi:ATP-dependent DNA ligase